MESVIAIELVPSGYNKDCCESVNDLNYMVPVLLLEVLNDEIVVHRTVRSLFLDKITFSGVIGKLPLFFSISEVAGLSVEVVDKNS